MRTFSVLISHYGMLHCTGTIRLCAFPVCMIAAHEEIGEGRFPRVTLGSQHVIIVFVAVAVCVIGCCNSTFVSGQYLSLSFI
jgi:hypothetical protein